jgi:hypothetical protein
MLRVDVNRADFGFWILDFGFWILDFGFWIIFWFRTLPFVDGNNPKSQIQNPKSFGFYETSG